MYALITGFLPNFRNSLDAHCYNCYICYIKKTGTRPKKFTPVNLPVGTVDKIRRLKIAYSFSSGKSPSYAEMFDLLLDSLEKTNPGLYNTFLNIKATSVDQL